MLSGVDFDAQFELLPELMLKQQFTLVKGYEVSGATKGRPLINLPPAELTHALSYKSDSLSDLEILLESTYNWAQNEFPDTNFEAFIPETQSFELIDVSTPPKAYHLINLELRYPLSIHAKGSGFLTFRMENVFSTAYRNYLNSNRFYADEIGRNLLISLTTTF